MASPKFRPCTLLLAFIALASVTAQTFQYSRGWTNGKRDGHKRLDNAREIANNLEKFLSPCQINKLKYILEGRPLTERIFTPCDYTEDDNELQSKRTNSKTDRNQDPFDAFL